MNEKNGDQEWNFSSFNNVNEIIMNGDQANEAFLRSNNLNDDLIDFDEMELIPKHRLPARIVSSNTYVI